MSIDAVQEENIYDNIVIMVNPNTKTFTIRNVKLDITIASNIKDLDIALLIRKAYGDGYYDATIRNRDK